MGKIRDLFKKTEDIKGTFHAKMGSIKDRNGLDLTEAEDIKKRWQEYTEEQYKKDLNDPDNLDSVVIHLKSNILEKVSFLPNSKGRQCQRMFKLPHNCIHFTH